MTCCILEKTTSVTILPGLPGHPGFSGSPAKPAYCAASLVHSCEWVPNPDVTKTVRQELNPLWTPAYEGSKYLYFVEYRLNGSLFYEVTLPWSGESYTSINGVPIQIYQCADKTVTTCYPAIPAIPAIPFSPPTQSQTILGYSLGWNSWSRAIDPLLIGTSFNFTVQNNVYAAFFGLGNIGLDGQPINTFGHGLMIDGNGVWVFEYGNPVYQLANNHTSTTQFEIERRYSGVITYRVGASEYTSSTTASGTLYPYTYLYSGGDRVLCAEYAVVANNLSIDADMAAVKCLMAEGDYFIVNANSPAFTSDITCSEIEVISLQVNLPGFKIGMGEGDYSFIDAEGPLFTVSMMQSVYTPPVPTTLYANMTPFACFMFMPAKEYCDLDADGPAFRAVMGEGPYAFINATGPAATVYMVSGVRLDMSIMSDAFVFDDVTIQPDLVMVLLSSGQLVSVQSMSHIWVAEYISALTGASVYSEAGEYNATLLSYGKLMSLQTLALDGKAALDSVGRVWVVNLDSAASTQYENFGFNSFFVRNGESYGVADDGVYRLSGNTDLLEPITAQINTGSTRLGSAKDKRLPAVYINAASDGKLILKVEVDGGAAYYYEARSSTPELKNNRVDTGRGLIGNNWTFTLMNQDGDDFELANLEFVPVQGARRI